MVTATPDELQSLLGIQEHDTALDRLARRRADLPERAPLAAGQTRRAELEDRRSVSVAALDEVLVKERRLDHEASAAETHADTVEKTLYSGTITSPKELQALQADLEQLRRQQRALEDLELEVMEERETAEQELAAIDASIAEVTEEIADLTTRLAAAEHEVDLDVADEQAKREALVSTVNAALVADYEARRGRNRNRAGIGIAQLVGTRCQGCGLTIPSVEVDRFRHAEPGTICCPEDCECIVVTS